MQPKAVNGTYYQAVEKTSRTLVAIKIDFTVKFSVFFSQISQLVHMEQTEQFCLGMERLDFPTFFGKYCSLPQVDFEKRNFCCLTKGGAFDFSERARLGDLIQTRIFVNPFISQEMFFSRDLDICVIFFFR